MIWSFVTAFLLALVGPPISIGKIDDRLRTHSR